MCQFIVSMRRMHLIQTSTTKCILSQIKNQNKTINRFVQYKFTQPAQIWKLSLLAEDLGSLTEKKNSLSGSVRCYVGAFFFCETGLLKTLFVSSRYQLCWAQADLSHHFGSSCS